MKLIIRYDRESDTLDLGNGRPAGYGDDVSEYLVVNSNESGEVVGFTLENAAELLRPFLGLEQEFPSRGKHEKRRAAKMLPDKCQMALKEWAVTVQSLAQGEQILLLRKGGIHEEGKDFRVIHPEFLLYPTYEHQREDLLKDVYQSTLRQVLQEPRQEDQITFSHWARVEETIEVDEQGKVDDLSPHYIWTNDYAQSRLRWKPTLPLSIMLLRVYRLEHPVSVPFLPEYRGCTSWVEVLADVPLGNLEPVLADGEFQRKVDEIKGCLGASVAAA